MHARIMVLAAVVLSVGLTLTGPASSTAITFAYSGTVTQVAALDPASPFPDPVDFGTPFSGTYTFDSTATNGILGDPHNASYASAGAGFGITLQLGGLNLSYTGLAINVTNDAFFIGDAYGVIHFESSCANPTCPDIEITLGDPSATALNSLAQPLLPPPLASFLTATFFFADTISDNQVELAGVIDSLSCLQGCAQTQVPVPGSALLTLIALMVLVFALRCARPGAAVRGADVYS